jgi:hypothetical protein
MTKCFIVSKTVTAQKPLDFNGVAGGTTGAAAGEDMRILLGTETCTKHDYVQ